VLSAKIQQQIRPHGQSGQSGVSQQLISFSIGRVSMAEWIVSDIRSGFRTRAQVGA